MDAKIIIALKRKQPQTRNELISSGIEQSGFYRNIPLLINRGIIKEGAKGYALWDYIEQPNLWNSVKNEFSKAGAHLVKMTVQKASDGGFDPVTGWPQPAYDGTESSIRGIMVLRSAKELVGVAQSFKIFIERPFAGAGVLLTQDPIELWDRFWWKGKLYVVKDTEERDDAYNFSFRIGYLEWLPE